MKIYKLINSISLKISILLFNQRVPLSYIFFNKLYKTLIIKKDIINEIIRVTKNNGIVSICNSTGKKYVKIFSEDYIDSSEAILHSSSKLLDLFNDNIGEVIFKHHSNDEINRHLTSSKHSNYLIKIKK